MAKLWFSARRAALGRAMSAVLAMLVAVAPAFGGIRVVGSDGASTTTTNGITYTGTSSFVTTGTDGVQAFAPNGISAPWTSGIVFTGADAVGYASPVGLLATGVDRTSVNSADGMSLSGSSPILVTDLLGHQYQADSVSVVRPNGIVFTGADGIVFTGADGIVFTGADGGSILRTDGITATNPTGIVFTGADSVDLVTPDGATISVDPNGIVFTGADGIVFTGADGNVFTGADALTLLGLDGLPLVGALGLQSLDPELADLLNRLTDDSSVNAAVVYHHMPTSADINDLTRRGVLGGTRFKALPIILVTTTKRRLLDVSHLPAVRAIYGNRTLQLSADDSRTTTGVTRVAADADLAGQFGASSVTGDGVTVGVLDTGLNALHPDLAGRVVQNVALLQTPPLPLGFLYPLNLENLPTTDLVSGHGTFVGGIVAGNGAASAGRLKGVAPKARLVGLSAGVLDLPHVLAGFDYVLTKGPQLGIRVLNCSFSSNTVFDVNDPVNVATKLLHDAGVTVVFSAGNAGPGASSLNPYAAAPWVVSVGATDDRTHLAAYSSRGAFGSALARPTLVAPGTSVISLRSSPVLSVTGILGIESGADLANLSLLELPSYTTASGTSFSAPQVAGTIALMLQANPSLTPDQIRDLLQRSATPMPRYFAHEVGAGMLNAHAAVLEAAFASRRSGTFRASLDRGQVRFGVDRSQSFTGAVTATGALTVPISIPAGAVQASVDVAWGPIVTTNDLALSVFAPNGAAAGSSNSLNLLGLLGRRERVALDAPTQGVWQARVSNSIPLLGSSQPVSASVEIATATVGPFTDVAGLSADARRDVETAVRSYVMLPSGSRFRPSLAVTRGALAQSIVLAGAVPQYLAGGAQYTDVVDASTRLFVESVQRAPGGACFPDAAPGSAFSPRQSVDRLSATVALVRAAGYGAEAEARAGAALGLVDESLVPDARRGYVAVALERGLLTAGGGAFRPGDALTRVELAHALVTLLGFVAPSLASAPGSAYEMGPRLARRRDYDR